MADDRKDHSLQNLIVFFLLTIVTVFTAFHEGYIPLISLPFGLSLIAGFLISLWLAMSISTKRFLSLIVVISVIEYIKETIGVRSGLWEYHGVHGFYNFGVWAWVLGGLSAYTIATKIVTRQIRKMKFSPARRLNPIIIAIISTLIPLTLGKYWGGTNWLFWLFYIVLLIVSIYSASMMDFPVFAGIVATAWIVGNPSEFLGSAKSNVWTFTYHPGYPPFFLLAGCWPLEILVQYSLSAFLADEPLDKNTF